MSNLTKTAKKKKGGGTQNCTKLHKIFNRDFTRKNVKNRSI